MKRIMISLFFSTFILAGPGGSGGTGGGSTIGSDFRVIRDIDSIVTNTGIKIPALDIQRYNLDNNSQNRIKDIVSLELKDGSYIYEESIQNFILKVKSNRN